MFNLVFYCKLEYENSFNFNLMYVIGLFQRSSDYYVVEYRLIPTRPTRQETPRAVTTRHNNISTEVGHLLANRHTTMECLMRLRRFFVPVLPGTRPEVQGYDTPDFKQ